MMIVLNRKVKFEKNIPNLEIQFWGLNFLSIIFPKIGETDAAIPFQESNLQEDNNDEKISNESNTQTENQADHSFNSNSDGTTQSEIKQKPRKKLMKSKKVVSF